MLPADKKYEGPREHEKNSVGVAKLVTYLPTYLVAKEEVKAA